ncbi:MAG: hypothetical protein DI529_06485 [Chryseobacterium sp.]|nr:MAG: hypothetical protein DI529_06485 [Chryseobacterium sp.]
MKNIPVRIGWELFLFILIVMFFTSYQQLMNQNWKALTSPIIISGLILVLCFSIKYKLDSEFFYVKNSIFGTTKINVKEISKIEKTWNPISSPAPSIIGRVEIYYGNNNIIISPKNFEEFKNELLKINPNITVKE